jgi:hypothetical protein
VTAATATLRTIDGQTHMIGAKVLAPVLTEFFESVPVGAKGASPR